MMHSEASLQGSLVQLLLPDVCEVEVTSHYDLLWSDRSHLSELVFGHERFLLTYLLQHG